MQSTATVQPAIDHAALELQRVFNIHRPYSLQHHPVLHQGAPKALHHVPHDAS